MRERLQRILSLLCVLALAVGCLTAAVAEEGNVQMETRVISVAWKDNDNADGLRPASVSVSLAGQTLVLSEANHWTGDITVPAGTGSEWTYDTVTGYAATLKAGDISLLTYHRSEAPTIDVSASVVWEDAENARQVRPESVQLMLLADGAAYGEPITVKAPAWTATWKNMPKYKAGTETEITYTVKQLTVPAGYTVAESGLTVTNTLETAKLSLTVTLAGAPEGSDLSGLTLTVAGPDPSMPRTLSYSDIASGAYDFGEVLPGAYLVRNSNADSLLEGYVMDGENSKVADAVYVKPGESATLEFKYTWKLPEAYEAEEDYDPLANIGNLTFEILGPDPRMPMTIYYSQFTDGKYELPDLVPGVYTVIERNAETLVKYYTLTSASITGMAMTVDANGSSTVKLFNQYTVQPTPEPDEEFVDIPVTKTWNDNNNADGNRPESVTVRLYADGVEVDSHVLTAAEGWSFTFVEKPRYQEDHKTEIVYTVGEDAVNLYKAEVNGYNIVNNYAPEETSVSVTKIWDDNDNEQGLRPDSIYMILNNGQADVATVKLSEANGWTATVNHLPTIVNGQKAVYGWREQEVLNYSLENVEQQGNTMIFTNKVWTRPENPSDGSKRPKTPGQTMYVFEDYDTPLGVEVVINHVGDCYD